MHVTFKTIGKLATISSVVIGAHNMRGCAVDGKYAAEAKMIAATTIAEATAQQRTLSIDEYEKIFTLPHVTDRDRYLTALWIADQAINKGKLPPAEMIVALSKAIDGRFETFPKLFKKAGSNNFEMAFADRYNTETLLLQEYEAQSILSAQLPAQKDVSAAKESLSLYYCMAHLVMRAAIVNTLANWPQALQFAPSALAFDRENSSNFDKMHEYARVQAQGIRDQLVPDKQYVIFNPNEYLTIISGGCFCYAYEWFYRVGNNNLICALKDAQKWNEEFLSQEFAPSQTVASNISITKDGEQKSGIIFVTADGNFFQHSEDTFYKYRIDYARDICSHEYYVAMALTQSFGEFRGFVAKSVENIPASQIIGIAPQETAPAPETAHLIARQNQR